MDTYLENMMKVFNGVYEKCKKMIKFSITYEKALSFGRRQAVNQIIYI